jgi:hypothetical protein
MSPKRRINRGVYSVNRLKAALADPDLDITPLSRQRITERLEAAEAQGYSTVELAEDTRHTPEPEPLFDHNPEGTP